MSGGIYINGIQKGLVAPLADATGNETVAEVVGNKTDTVAGDSLVALSKQAIAAIPSSADVTAIKAVTDLIPDAGAMTSIAQEATLGTPAGASLAADIASVQSSLQVIDDHIHMSSKVYPTLADGVTVTADVTAWTLGSFAVVVPASTITSDFDIHHISVEALSANDIYELVLYSGADLSETEIGRVRFTKNANQDGTMDVPFQTPIVSANSQIKAKLATKAGSSTADISIYYHTY